MGFWSDILKRPQPIAYFTPNVNYLGPEELMAQVNNTSVAQLWRTQPHLRTVISFLARNIAQVGLHSFVRDGEDRLRDRTSPLARAFANPGDGMTSYDLIYALVGDLALYDRAYWILWQDDSAEPHLRRLPPTWVKTIRKGPFEVTSYEVRFDGQVVKIAADQVLAFTGYSPESHACGSPTVESLKATIGEQIEATRYRAQVWKRGGRVSAVLQRPKDAPGWSNEAREAFREDWYSKYTGRGSKAGGTPILEDGMTLNRIDFNAQEQQFIEAAKLSLSTVAAAFHVNPTMIGVLDNANYSNVREFRRMLYGDTLGPLLAQIEARINTFLIPMLGMDAATHYAEFNIGEKLQGSFEEQASVMSTLVGRPILTADEARAMFNRPALGGDAAGLVTPLNVLIGGQASPRDSAPKMVCVGEKGPELFFPNVSGRIIPNHALKSGPTDPQREKVAGVLGRFFKRQGAVVLSAIGGGGDWWDAKRWDDELAEDLLKVSHTLADLLGKAEAERLGYSDTWDADRTVEFLTAVAARFAGQINETTKSQLDESLDSDEPDPAHVFDVAQESRAAGGAVAVTGFVVGFAATEAARQIAQAEGVEPTKTWITGPNPRPEHAAMNGETVGIDEPFSNGMDWPGSGGGPNDVGCNCGVDISIP